jgi:hypothetical protein
MTNTSSTLGPTQKQMNIIFRYVGEGLLKFDVTLTIADGSVKAKRTHPRAFEVSASLSSKTHAELASLVEALRECDAQPQNTRNTKYWCAVKIRTDDGYEFTDPMFDDGHYPEIRELKHELIDIFHDTVRGGNWTVPWTHIARPENVVV